MMREKSVSAGHSRREVLQLVAASTVALALPTGLSAASGPLRSAGVLTFGPNNVLFVGDITGAKIHALALRDKDLTSQTDIISGNFHNFEGRDHVVGLDQKLAALFGTTIDEIVINDMAVHQPTQQIFLSVERGRGINAIPAIVKVNHGSNEHRACLPSGRSSRSLCRHREHAGAACCCRTGFPPRCFERGRGERRCGASRGRSGKPHPEPVERAAAAILRPRPGMQERFRLLQAKLPTLAPPQ
jgi:hypothetical protein